MAEEIRLLLVEDSEDDALLLLRELKRVGFAPDSTRVQTADDMRSALVNGDWDLIISDYSMPNFDGLAALKVVQDEGIDLPFIIVSGTIGEHVAVEAMRAGAHDYVMKDRLARLGPAVERELREAGERRARRRAETAYRSLVESSLQGFLIVQERRIVFTNSAWAEITGYSTDELRDMSAEEMMALVHPKDRMMVWSRYDDRLGGKPVPERYEFRVIHKNGEIRWVEMRASAVEFGGNPAVQAAIVDITERIRHEREQRAIVAVAASLRVATNRSELITLLLGEVINLLTATGAAIAMRDFSTGEVQIELALGVWAEATGERIPSNKGLTGRIVAGGQPYVNNEISPETIDVWSTILAAARAVAGVPLIAAKQTIGVLWIGRENAISKEDALLLTAIAEMTASALRRIVLHDELERSNQELTDAYDSTLEGWARALELRDADTEGHTRRVVELTTKIGKRMGFAEPDLVHLRRGALLHDIGKMAIPDQILRKPGILNEAEWEIMRSHPVHALEMLSKIDYLKPAVDIPYCHHERWDGSGYPRGLEGQDIPLAARIFAVVDVWDAVSSDRPYRPAWPKERALKHLHNRSGTHFDPEVVEIFSRLLLEE